MEFMHKNIAILYSYIFPNHIESVVHSRPGKYLQLLHIHIIVEKKTL